MPSNVKFKVMNNLLNPRMVIQIMHQLPKFIATAGPKTPPEVQRAGRAAFRDSAMLQVLLDQWASCDGAWTESEFYIQVKMKKKNRTFGSRRWMCKHEIVAKFGSVSVASEIIMAKTMDPEVAKTHVRANPDLHGQDSEDPCK